MEEKGWKRRGGREGVEEKGISDWVGVKGCKRTASEDGRKRMEMRAQ